MEDLYYRFMRVSGKSDPAKVAGALSNHIREAIKYGPYLRSFGELSCVGAFPTNQGVKAIAICNGMMGPSGVQILIKPAFGDIEIHGEDRTAMRLIVMKEMI